ncbi:unnamed protein product [Clonostachys rhizophaga]|uniref:DUF6536 domain-containing protein n=1 Tax=Clonostachys rhizophaga TaxID=160324 RepID=A0A9N9YPZ9_9HYPO|nr:unnamed protein product [Clonostachys rhizophaga]
MAIESIPEIPGIDSSNGSRNVTTSSSNNRSALNWPFRGHSLSSGQHSAQHSAKHSAQHSAKLSQNSFARSHSSFGRRNSGWINLRPASSVLGSDIIPDYVVNFLRGETPESLAKKREKEEAGRAENEAHVLSDRFSGFDFFSQSRSGSRAGDVEGMLAAGEGQQGFARKMMTGWRAGIVLIIFLGLLILVGTIVCLVLAVINNFLTAEEMAVVTKDCAEIGRIDQGIQAAVNVLSLFFIASATYVSQVLVSPTREEVDAAHAKFSWFDIGIPTLKNFGGISTLRTVLALTAVFLAVGSQIIYNSLIFTDIGTSKANDETCSLILNGPILGALAVLNLLFILVLALALATTSTHNPLVTLGDALSSFLADPDSTTQGACLLSKADIKTGLWANGEIKSKYWFNEPHRWYQTPSRTRWLIWAVIWLLSAGMSAAMLSVVMVDNSNAAFQALETPTKTYILSKGIPSAGVGVLLALPHLILAALYFSTNAMLSVLYLSHEFAKYAEEAMALRVSSYPFGLQRASLYITLPRPISWILFFVFAAMGFMLSQAFNLVKVDDGYVLGMNPLPTVILLALVAATGLLVLGMSLRRTDFPPAEGEENRTANPLILPGGSCSAVLSARCHRGTREGSGMVAQVLGWGVIQENSDPKVGHAALSGLPVEPMKVGKAYA